MPALERKVGGGPLSIRIPYFLLEEMGPEVARAFERKIQECLREADTLFRVWKDEFRMELVIEPTTTLKEVCDDSK